MTAVTCRVEHQAGFRHFNFTVEGLEDQVDLGIHYREKVDAGDNRPYLALEISLCRVSSKAAWRPTLTFGLSGWKGDHFDNPTVEDKARLRELAKPYIQNAVTAWYRDGDTEEIHRPRIFSE